MISNALSNPLEFILEVLVRLVVVMTALPVHECAHGLVARKLGDDTAQRQGRLTLNPLVHFDPIGTTILLLTGFGWAKPVEVNPRNFKNQKTGMALTSLAGPVSNILFALVLVIVQKVLALSNAGFLFNLLEMMIEINIGLAVFNLIPIPPLDGAKIFGAFLPDRVYWGVMQYERYIMMALFALLIFTPVLTIPINWLSNGLRYFLDMITGFIR